MENNIIGRKIISGVCVHSIESYALSAFPLPSISGTHEAKAGENEKLRYFEWGNGNRGLKSEIESLIGNGKAYSTISDSVSISLGNSIIAIREGGVVEDESVVDFLESYREEARSFLLDYTITGLGAFFCRVHQGTGEISEFEHSPADRIRLCQNGNSREMKDIDTLLYSDFWHAPVFSGEKKNVFQFPVYQKPKKSYDFKSTSEFNQYVAERRQRYSQGFYVIAYDYTPTFFPYFPPKWLGALIHIEIANLLADYFKSMLTKGIHGDYILTISDSFRAAKREELEQIAPALSQAEIEAQLSAWEKDFSTKIRGSLSGSQNKGTGISFFVPPQELEGTTSPIKIIRIEHNQLDDNFLKIVATSNLEISAAIGMPAGITNNPTKDTFSPTGGSGSEVRTALALAQEILLSDYQEKLLKPLKRLMREMNGWKYNYRIAHTNIVSLNQNKSGIVSNEGRGEEEA